MISNRDKFNIMGAISQATVDDLNREFYGKITYPWPQMTYPVYADSQCGTIFLNQEIGDWTHSRIPRRAKIWVAGCGSNQATLTALKFPKADIFATDISVPSLEVCQKNLDLLEIRNVKLKEQSLNDADYTEEFDFVICTGVIHHNADPSIPLGRLAKAMRPEAVLELGVYNYYHRILTTAYQKAMRLLFSTDPNMGLDQQLEITRELMDKFPIENTMGFYLSQQKHESREYLADSFLQPVEHSYTVETLVDLLASKGLEFTVPCMNVFDKAAGRLTWNVEFPNSKVAEHYDALPDYERWQVTNLLSIEKSPSLFIYAQRSDSPIKRKSEKEICDDFLATKFDRYATTVTNYVGGNGNYKLTPTPVPHPSPRVPVEEYARRIFRECDGETTIADIIKRLKLNSNFYAVNNARVQLTTPWFPYLKAVNSQTARPAQSNGNSDWQH